MGLKERFYADIMAMHPEVTGSCNIEISKNVKVTFLNNGHLIGAAVILVQISYPKYENINQIRMDWLKLQQVSLND